MFGISLRTTRSPDLWQRDSIGKLPPSANLEPMSYLQDVLLIYYRLLRGMVRRDVVPGHKMPPTQGKNCYQTLTCASRKKAGLISLVQDD